MRPADLGHRHTVRVGGRDVRRQVAQRKRAGHHAGRPVRDRDLLQIGASWWPPSAVPAGRSPPRWSPRGSARLGFSGLGTRVCLAGLANRLSADRLGRTRRPRRSGSAGDGNLGGGITMAALAQVFEEAPQDIQLVVDRPRDHRPLGQLGAPGGHMGCRDVPSGAAASDPS